MDSISVLLFKQASVGEVMTMLQLSAVSKVL